ncbi:MAG: amidohydrolase family protein [Bacteroidota bacterium]
MKDAGLTPYEILRTGTEQVARYMEPWGKFGMVKEGYSADLLLLNENPLKDITHIKNQAGVMVGGRWYTKAWIDSELEALETKHKR